MKMKKRKHPGDGSVRLKSFYAWTMLLSNNPAAALKMIYNVCRPIAANESEPQRVRRLADSGVGLSKDLMQKFRSPKANPKDKETARMLLLLGGIYEGLRLSEYERPAMAGIASRMGAQRKGRAAPEGSVRSVLEANNCSRSMSTGRLLNITRKAFPKRSPQNLSRQIRNWKKSGR